MRRFLPGLAIAILLCGCSWNIAKPTEVRNLDENFEKQITELLADTRQLEGKRVSLTGEYCTRTYAGCQYAFLCRTSALNGAPVGLELAWDGEQPEEGDTLCAVGTLKTYLQNGVRYACVQADSLMWTGFSQEQIRVEGEQFLSTLSMLYEKPELLGAQVSITGQFAAERLSGTAYYRVERQAHYRDGRAGVAGLEFILSGALPKQGEWITASGRLCSYRIGDAQYLTLQDAAWIPAEPQEPAKE